MSLTGNATAMEVLKGRIHRCNTLVVNAYQIAVKNGFSGTEEEWLLSLGATDEQVTKAVENYIAENGILTAAQYSALENLLSIAVYKKDPTEEWLAFRKAFHHGPWKYSITYNLTNCTCSQTITEIEEGKLFTADLIPNAGYTIDYASVKVVMGGVDITYEGSAGDYIAVGSVTGDLVITAKGVAV